MTIELAKKYSSKVDEAFAALSKTSLVTNQDYDWRGAHTVAVYKFTTATMNDYGRSRTPGLSVVDDGYGAAVSVSESISRYGDIYDLNGTVQEMMLTRDRSFIFNMDKMDVDESALVPAEALARQIREVVIPERDKYIYQKMADNAGIKPAAVDLDSVQLYDELLKATEAMDEAEVPDERVLVVSPKAYAKLKKEIVALAYNDEDAIARAMGVVGFIDGMAVVKVPSNLLPEDFGFMVAHESACTAPVKLEDFGIHYDTPLSSGAIITGRIVYDAFVLDNKKNGIYYQAKTIANKPGEDNPSK